MFPALDTDWIEEPIKSSKKTNTINLTKDFIIEPEKIFYYMDTEDIAFRMKLNYLLISSNTVVAENKIWGINVNDSNSNKLLFALQLNDTEEDCTIELLDETQNIKVTLEGIIHNPEKVNDNIKITMIPDENFNVTNGDPGRIISFFLDFKFPNELIFKNIPALVGKDLNCYLSYYILDKENPAFNEPELLVEDNVLTKNTLSMVVPSLDTVNSLIQNTVLKDDVPLNESLTDYESLSIKDTPLTDSTTGENNLSLNETLDSMKITQLDQTALQNEDVLQDETTLPAHHSSSLDNTQISEDTSANNTFELIDINKS